MEVKCLAAACGWRRRCLGIKLEVHGLSTPQAPQHSLISRTFSPNPLVFSLSNYTMRTFVILSVILAHALLSNAGVYLFSLSYPDLGTHLLSTSGSEEVSSHG